MRPDPATVLAYPVERLEDGRMKALIEELAEAITMTNDADSLRDIGISLKLMGDFCRSQAFEQSRNHW